MLVGPRFQEKVSTGLLKRAAVVALENIPEPEAPVTTKIKLAAADPANRHTDIPELTSGKNLRLAALVKLSHPLGIQLLVGGHQVV